MPVTISALDYSTYDIVDEFETKFEIKNNIRIAFNDNYTLYKTMTIVSEVKGNSTNTDIYLNDTTGRKVYSYYVIKNGERTGLVYSTLFKKRTFERTQFLTHEGLGHKNSAFFNLDLGKPDAVERNTLTGEVEIEKHLNKVRSTLDPDSLYRYYRRDLKAINFSFSPVLDERHKSKLWKVACIYNSTEKNPKRLRYEAYWKIERATLTPTETDTLLSKFRQFRIDEKKLGLQ